MKELEHIGNEKLLEMPKVGFLASKHVASDEVLRCYDWATKQTENQQCIVSGFSSRIEKDVLHFLLKEKRPVIMVLARRMYAKLPKEWRSAINDGSMLLISTSQSARQSRQTSSTRNHYVAEISDTIYLAGITERSSLQRIIQEYPSKCILIRG